ncbi:hypothetical protein DFH94DRAFT_620353, partial [Russula ochroleuca]
INITKIADMLLLKTIPEANNWKGYTLKPRTNLTAAPAKKKPRTSVKVEGLEGMNIPHNCGNTIARTVMISPASSFQVLKTKSAKKSLIYLFYEVIANGSDGTSRDDSNVHYCCLHGAHKVCTIKKSMRSNLSALVNNLHIQVKPMFQLYCILKDQDKPPMPKEVDIASGKRQLDGNAEAEYLEMLEKSLENIKKAFQVQQIWAIGPWDQAKFEQLLTEWIVACDQPFDEVEKPKFVVLM